ncbi:MAG: phosphonate metabolism transcriptional regulator PhnF [Rhodospirillum sp.]|nr:phosphonate metabolism transcriptional regulator PhnF [Rhodospirillum sp.]MCF8489760.1 phosphonate metabolism transcriptional regulator PhnF [Rhodospirillum sp.]MCF8501275.1 phosphonate metabolism transcriptional regulator PhnF [Rhodospirillum sp.]
MESGRSTGLPLWRRIQDDIAGQIRLGKVVPGERLPTEYAYAEHYGVNRHTVRQAIAGLVDMGLVRVEQGRGTFAREPVMAYPLSRRTRFSEIVLSKDRRPSGILLDHGVDRLDGDIAKALSLPVGARAIRMEMAGEANGHRIFVSTAYFPEARCDGIVAHFQESGSVTKALAALGIADYVRKITRIQARLPSPADARALRQPRNRPVLVTESINVDSEGGPVEYGITRFASDWITLTVET